MTVAATEVAEMVGTTVTHDELLSLRGGKHGHTLADAHVTHAVLVLRELTDGSSLPSVSALHAHAPGRGCVCICAHYILWIDLAMPLSTRT